MNQALIKRQIKKLIKHQIGYVWSQLLAIPSPINYHDNYVLCYVVFIYFVSKANVVNVNPNSTNSPCDGKFGQRSKTSFSFDVTHNPLDFIFPIFRLMFYLNPLQHRLPDRFNSMTAE